MAKAVPSVLDHVFSARDIYRRRCFKVWLWSILSFFVLLLLLLDAGLFVGLLADRGRLTVDFPAEQLARFRQLTGLAAGVEPDSNPDPDQNAVNPEKADAPLPPIRKPPEVVHFSQDQYGILPAVWQSRDAWWSDGLGWLFRNVELLQSNVLAAITLLLAGAFLLTARVTCLSRLRLAAQQAALDAVAPVRRNVHRQALRLGPEDLDGTGMTTATEVFTVDIETVRTSLAKWIEYDIRFPLEILALALVVVSIEPLISAQYLLFLGVAWYYLDAQSHRAQSDLKMAKDHAEVELHRQAAGFQAARLVRGLGIEQVDHDHFANHLLRYHGLAAAQYRATEHADHWRVRDIAACSAIVAFLLFILATRIVLPDGELTISSGFVFVVAWLMAIPGTQAFRARKGILHTATLSAEKIQKVLDQIPTVSQAVGARFLQPLTKTLHFDSVTYRNQAGRALINELDLALEAGRTYSLVSLDPLESIALISMLPRFIEPQQGRILFDGEDIAWSTLESLRAETVFVGANEPLLPGTVLDNIRGGRTEYTLQQATDAAKLTHAHNFIVKMFDGYESDLPERADLMDVSQRFRLSLARAMLRNPALLIIEEPRVSFDEDTKALLSDAYDRICRDRTVIFLPGRMSSVRRSDQVIVLFEGRVAAIGPRSKLVSMSPTYMHWEYVNFNTFRHQDT